MLAVEVGGSVGVEATAIDPLVERARRGELGAFESLYRAHVGKVFALMRRLCRDVPMAEERTQEVFVRAFERLSSFRGDSAFSTWLHRLAVNVALEERRKTMRREARVTLADAPIEPPTPPARGGGLALDLERALDTLPEGARTVLVLHDVEGYSHEEIASLLDISVGTTKSQLHRARKLVREVLAR
jgi:RNA polymerase sigma factor (sigma-70 family)